MSRIEAVYFFVLAHKPVIQPVTPGFVPGLTVKGFTFLLEAQRLPSAAPGGLCAVGDLYKPHKNSCSSWKQKKALSLCCSQTKLPVLDPHWAPVSGAWGPNWSEST